MIVFLFCQVFSTIVGFIILSVNFQIVAVFRSCFRFSIMFQIQFQITVFRSCFRFLSFGFVLKLWKSGAWFPCFVVEIFFNLNSQGTFDFQNLEQNFVYHWLRKCKKNPHLIGWLQNYGSKKALFCGMSAFLNEFIWMSIKTFLWVRCYLLCNFTANWWKVEIFISS